MCCFACADEIEKCFTEEEIQNINFAEMDAAAFKALLEEQQNVLRRSSAPA
jgi:hypothetical protein